MKLWRGYAYLIKVGQLNFSPFPCHYPFLLQLSLYVNFASRINLNLVTAVEILDRPARKKTRLGEGSLSINYCYVTEVMYE